MTTQPHGKQSQGIKTIDLQPQTVVDDERIRMTILSLVERKDRPQIEAGGDAWKIAAKQYPGSHGIYMHDHDTILMIGFEAIPDDEWLMVLVHEWGHATGIDSRLGRRGVLLKASEDSKEIEAREELTAWLFTAFSLKHLGCLTSATHRECVGQISLWSRPIDGESCQSAYRDAEKAVQYVFLPSAQGNRGFSFIEAAPKVAGNGLRPLVLPSRAGRKMKARGK